VVPVSLAVMPNDLADEPVVDPLDRRSGLRFAAYKWGVGVITGIVGLAMYEIIGRVELHRSTALLDTAVDRAIPLLPVTTWFYEPFYVGIFVIAVIGFQSRWLFHRALVCVIGNALVAAIGHCLVRAQYPRPVLVPPFSDLSMAFLAFVYRIDPPGNVFPSLHVAHAFVLALLLRYERPLLGRVTLAMACVLALSTLTTKQHFVADVLAGLLMALAGRAWVRASLPVGRPRLSAPGSRPAGR
jgi:membrane-associated phospholipid phosphatase